MQPTPERAPAPDPVTIHPARVGFKGGMVVWRVRRGDLWTLCMTWGELLQAARFCEIVRATTLPPGPHVPAREPRDPPAPRAPDPLHVDGRPGRP
jgi:hypothetical protein